MSNMTINDVIRVALDRRAKLREEAMELDMFLRITDTLVQGVENGRIAKPYDAANQANEAAASDGAAAADVDMKHDELSRRTIVRRRA